jgi:hypothetical protein
MSPVTMEIHTVDILRLPLGAVDPRTVADIAALSTAEGMPKALARTYATFADRMKNEISDLPSGHGFRSFVAEIAEIPAAEVPEPVRAAVRLQAAAEARPAVDREQAAALCAVWDAVPPQEVRVAEAPPPEEVKVKRMSAKEPVAEEPTRKRAATTRKKRAAPVRDEERMTWLRDAALERLGRHGEGGLLEDVLIAGICRASRDTDHQGVSAYDVKTALKELEAENRVKHSARRWRAAFRSW